MNEDAMLTGPHWWAVADGMGGHRAGDVASTITVDVLAGHATPTTTVEGVRRAVRDASVTVHRAATGPRAGMGTTVVGAAPLADGAVAVFHVGDSRCYRLHDGTLTLLTSDHTHVQELVDGGILHPSAATDHPLRNVVTRAVGLEPSVDADVVVVRPPVGRLLLCSDGLSGELTSRQIGRVLAGVGDPERAAHRLVQLVLDGAARDNVSAIVVDVDDDEEACAA
ncbi:MAG: PP2C family protein-serine/threonine phosphatase [Acidimicrobiia bacterium]